MHSLVELATSDHSFKAAHLQVRRSIFISELAELAELALTGIAFGKFTYHPGPAPIVGLVGTPRHLCVAA